MVNGKNKGNSFENKVLRIIRVRLDPDAFKSIGSGNSKDDKGDIQFRLGEIRFVAECKHHKTLSKNLLDKFWDKIKLESEMMHKVPLLIFKENYKPIKINRCKDVTDLFEDFLKRMEDEFE